MQLDIQKAVQRTHQGSAQDTSDDQTRITETEPGSQYRSHDGGKHDVCADGKVEHSHDHDKEEADRTSGYHDRSFKIAEQVAGFSEIGGCRDLEDRPGHDHKENQNHIAQSFSG